jgi:predicted metal-binding protein
MTDALHVVRICTTCRYPSGNTDSDAQPLGAELLANVEAIVAREPLEQVRFIGQRCLSSCNRSCAVAYSAAGKFTYVFGDLDPRTSAEDIVACARLYLGSPNGFLERAERPERLKTTIVARVPPPDR